MIIWSWPCILFCLLALAAHTAAAQQLAAWGQCGGLQGCPNGQQCSDAPWPGTCPDGYTCVRQDEYYWQCKADKSLQDFRSRLQGKPSLQEAGAAKQQQQQQQVLSQGPVYEWYQCGGVNGCGLTDGTCGDQQWATCSPGWSCNRANMYYWHCRPTDGAYPLTPQPPPPEAPPAEQQQQPADATAQDAAEDSSRPRGEATSPAQPEQRQQPAAAAGVVAKEATPADLQQQQQQRAADQAAARKAAAAAAAARAPVSPAPVPATSAKPRSTVKPAAPAPDTAKEAAAPAATGQQQADVADAATAGPEPVAAAPANATAPVAPRAANVTGRGATVPAGNQPLRLELDYLGTTVEEFQSNYGQGSLNAVSEVSGVPASSIKSTVSSIGSRPASSSSTSSRRLLQQAATTAAAPGSSSSGVTVAYSLSAADPAAAYKGLQEAAADNGSGFYAALDANGVPLRPAVRLDEATLVSQQQAAAAAASARQQRGELNQRDRWPVWKKLTVGLCVGVGGALLVLLALLALRLCKRRRHANKIRRHEDELVTIDALGPQPDVLATAGVAEQGGAKQGKADVLGVVRKSTAYDTDAGASDQGYAAAAAAAADGQQQRHASRDAAGRRAAIAYQPGTSTFESAAAAGAAVAALMESAHPSSLVISPAARNDAASAAAARSAPAHQQQHDRERAPWDAASHLPDGGPAGKRPAAANADPWRPPKPSEPWKPAAPWRPPSASFSIPQLAPAEQLPRSGPLDERGMQMRVQPISTSGGGGTRPAAAAAGFAAAAAGSSAAAAGGRHSRRGSAVDDDYPTTPTAAAGAAAGNGDGADGYQSGDERGYGTPRSNASYHSALSNAASDASFKSIRSGAHSESGSAVSFQSAETSRSYHSAASGQASASGVSHSSSAREFPRAYVPEADDFATASEDEPSPKGAAAPAPPAEQ